MAILREQAEALIREQISNEILQEAPKGSVFMSMARKLPNMTSNVTSMPVLDMLPVANWVNGDTGLKSTSEQAWDKVYINAAELAVIVPIPEAVLDDASFDIMGQVTPRLAEAIYNKVDQAVLFGTDRPTEWRNDIITAARQAGNNVSIPQGGDIYDAILGENGVFAKVEESGYMVTGAIATPSLKASLRGLRSGDGVPIFQTMPQDATRYALDGEPLSFMTNGAFDNSVARLIVGDWSQAVYAIRQDITVKLLDQGVITDSSGNIVYNLPQQDMIAVRVVFRMGWALPNFARMMDKDRVTVPFAYLEPSTPATTHTYTVTVQDSSNQAIAGAFVDVNGSRLKTNSSGQAVFNLRDGSYPVSASKAGYIKQDASVTMNGSNTTKTFTMVARS